MIWPKRNKEPERYYLFAGMGGRAARHKHRVILVWAIAAGLVVSSLVGVALYFVNKAR